MPKPPMNTPAQRKKRGERMYLRMAENGRSKRWTQITEHVVTLMMSGKLAFNPRKILRAEAAQVRAEKEAEPVQIVALPEPSEAIIRTPKVPEPTYSECPSGTYDHSQYYDMYRYRPPVDNSMDHPGD